MGLFGKEPETDSSPEHVNESSPPPVSLMTKSLAEESVARPRDVSSNLREGGVVLHKPVDARAYLDSRTKINGNLSFDGPAQIDGQIEGEIVAADHLVIGEGALVKAKIKAASVVVAGTVSGEITASRRLEILCSAKISGNLAAPKMVMHEGAMFEGHCAMKPEERREERKPGALRSEQQIEASEARSRAQNGA